MLLRISQKHKFEDHAETIRRKLKIIYKTSKPSTMSDFVMRLRNVGVATQICKDLNGVPNGIRYSVDGNKWLSGSSIKKLGLRGGHYRPMRKSVMSQSVIMLH